MIEFAGLLAYVIAVWLSLLYLDMLAWRRRRTHHRQRVAAYRRRAAHLQTLKGTP